MLQDYLRPNDVLTLNEQRAIFRYRTRSNPLKYNTPGSLDLEFYVCVKNKKRLFVWNHTPNFSGKWECHWDRP